MTEMLSKPRGRPRVVIPVLVTVPQEKMEDVANVILGMVRVKKCVITKEVRRRDGRARFNLAFKSGVTLGNFKQELKENAVLKKAQAVIEKEGEPISVVLDEQE